MRAILHIGTSKTGTTSLQKLFHVNSSFFEGIGVHYCTTLANGTHNHSRLAKYANNEVEIDFDAFKIEVDEAISTGCEYFVMSNEHCHSRVNTPNKVSRLISFLKIYFSDIVIFCSVRPQVEVGISRLSTVVKAGKKVSVEFLMNDVSLENKYYDYDNLFELWKDAFFIPYRSIGTLDFISSKMNWNIDGLTPVERQNEKIDINVMRVANKLISVCELKNIDGFIIREIIKLLVNKSSFKEPVYIGEELAFSLSQRFVSSNRAFCNKSGLNIEDLSYNKTGLNKESNLHKLLPKLGDDQLLNELLAAYINRIENIFVEKAGRLDEPQMTARYNFLKQFKGGLPSDRLA